MFVFGLGMQVYLRSDLGSLRRVQRLLLGMLASARKSSDPLASVQMVHRAIVESGDPVLEGLGLVKKAWC